MKSPITAKRLASALNIAGMIPQELADASGVSKASISQYLSGSHAPSNISSGKMGKILNVNPLWLMGFDVPMVEEDKTATSPTTQIPVYGRVAAGYPIEAIETILEMEDIPTEMARKGEYFGLRIKGDSMEPVIHDGDNVIVRQQEDAESGEIVIAIINGNDGCCKKLKKYENGIALISINPAYEPKYFQWKEVEEKPVRIIGKVVELRRKFE